MVFGIVDPVNVCGESTLWTLTTTSIPAHLQDIYKKVNERNFRMKCTTERSEKL